MSIDHVMTSTDKHTRQIQIRIADEMLREIHSFISTLEFPATRTDVIRAAIREYLDRKTFRGVG